MIIDARRARSSISETGRRIFPHDNVWSKPRMVRQTEEKIHPVSGSRVDENS
jgi:hypothetical protein